MLENNYFTDRIYEGDNNNFYMNNFTNNDINQRSNTQNYFFNNNPDDFNNINTNDFNNINNNLDNDNLFQMNLNQNEYNNGLVVFKNRINKLQNEVGKLNSYRNEIQDAIDYKLDNNNNLNKTQNIINNYENNYLGENNQGLKMNKSYDALRMNCNNYDFLFDSRNVEDFEDNNNLNNNFIEEEGNQLNNEDIDINNNMVNLENNNSNKDYNDQEDNDNSFIGFYDNIFMSKNFNIDPEIKTMKNMENAIPVKNIDINDKNDYKNIQLYEQNYQFNIPKTINNNFEKQIKENNNQINDNIQIVSNELTILTNENKEKRKDTNNIDDINNINYNNQQNDENTKNFQMNNNNEKESNLKDLDEIRQKELEKYDLIIAQAKELNNQFQLDQKSFDKKYNLSNNDKPNFNGETKGKEYNIKKEINPESKNIINLNNKDKKYRKEKIIINKNKTVSFTDDKIYIKYEQDDYILKLNVFNNQNEKINFVTHDLRKYIQRLKKREYLETAIVNCPIINYEKIINKMINLVKKENKVQAQNPRIDNKPNKSVKNPKIRLPLNKIENKKEQKIIFKIDKIGKGKKPIHNNLKIIENNHNSNGIKNINNIPKNNLIKLNKEKNLPKNKNDKDLKKNNINKKKKEKEDFKNLDIFENPIFKEGQKAINNLKKFFAENNLDDENNE